VVVCLAVYLHYFAGQLSGLHLAGV
jgi:hypothetical protein